MYMSADHAFSQTSTCNMIQVRDTAIHQIHKSWNWNKLGCKLFTTISHMRCMGYHTSPEGTLQKISRYFEVAHGCNVLCISGDCIIIHMTQIQLLPPFVNVSGWKKLPCRKLYKQNILHYFYLPSMSTFLDVKYNVYFDIIELIKVSGNCSS